MSCIEAENALAHLVEPNGNPYRCMGRRQGFQNEHVQSALDKIMDLSCQRFLPLEDQKKDIFFY